MPAVLHPIEVSRVLSGIRLDLGLVVAEVVLLAMLLVGVLVED